MSGGAALASILLGTIRRTIFQTQIQWLAWPADIRVDPFFGTSVCKKPLAEIRIS